MSGERDWEKDLLGPHRVVKPSLRGRGGPPREVRASTLSIAERLRAARGVPQAVVKISKYLKGREACRKNWLYNSRGEKLALETEEGELLRTREDQLSVLDAWALRFCTRKNSRDQANIIVSSVPGSSPEAVQRAARAFGKDAFKDRRYHFVLHNDKRHPHVHFAVEMQGREKKFDPRKKDLRRWRELWAEKAREQGIDMACSSRAARGVGRRGQKLPLHHMQQRGVTPGVTRLAVKEVATPGAETAWETYARARNAAERQAYRQSANELRASAKKASAADRPKLEAAAGELEQFADRMPVAKTRRQQLREAFNVHRKQRSPGSREPDDRER